MWGGRITWYSRCTACTGYRLLRLLVFFVLLVTSRCIHDSVPPPMFLPGASVITVRQGEVAVLPCAVKHLFTKQVAWRRRDEDDFLTIGEMTWIDDDKIAVEHATRDHDASVWNLVIDKVTSEDAGVYECQVTSKHGIKKLVSLNVVGPPIKDAVISIAGKRYVDLGESIHLICNASGGPRIPEDIDWFKDGDMIDSFKYPHVLIEKYQSMRDRAFISELIIDHARKKDSGEYVCRSSRNNIVNMKITVLKETKPPDPKRRDHGSVPESVTTSNSDSVHSLHSLHVTIVIIAVTYLFFTWTIRS